MKRERWERVQAVFEAALARPPAERELFVRAALAEDGASCDDVLRMLAAHEAGGPLDRLAQGLAPVPAGREGTAGDAHEARTTIGAWRLLEEIGRGGMGTVYLAERADGRFEKRAAVKLLRRDLPEADVRDRFLGEHRILARVEYTAVAQLLDAGITEEGRPWFAMEYVDGIPIDRWCGERGLGVRDRLQLFCEVCDAVQHVHTHLVVHRDIKPSNILVTADGRVKLLDFGIAKLLDPQAYPATAARTRTGQFLLTPEFASPEQLHGEPVTTASDVFQLGLLLFELLIGRRPLRVSEGAHTGETTGASASAAASGPLRREIDADLDTIVRKAMHAEPARRYASAEQLGEDVRRWLRGLPIRARPETPAYLVSRFVRRHRAGVAMAAASVLALIGFSLVTVLQARRIARERDRARQVSRLLTNLLESADPVLARGEQVTVREVIDRNEDRLRTELAGQPELAAELLGVLGQTRSRLGDYERALALERESLELERAALPADHAAIGESLRRIAALHSLAVRPDSALAVLDVALPILARRFGPRSAEVARAQANRAYAFQVKGDYVQAATLYEEAIGVQRSNQGADREDLAISLVNYGWIAQARGDLGAAETHMREALALRRTLWPPGDPRFISNLGSLASILSRKGAVAGADSLSAEQLEIARATYTPPHPLLASSLVTRASTLSRGGDTAAAALFREALDMYRRLGRVNVAEAENEFALHYGRRGDFASAEPLYRAAVAGYAALRGPRDVSTAIVATNHAWALHNIGRSEEADRIYRNAIAALETAWPSGDARLINPITDHGVALLALGRHADAEAQLRRALALATAAAPPDDNRVIRANARLGMCLTDQRRFAEAEPFLLAAHQVLIRRGIQDPFARRHVELMVRFYEQWRRPEEASRYRAMLPGG
jgi:serine/threonine-protein kinase